MLYLVNEMTFSGYSVFNLDLLYIIAILLGIFVIISKNPIVSVCAPFWISFALKLSIATVLRYFIKFSKDLSNEAKLIISLRM